MAIVIWQPKFSTQSVLVDRLKVNNNKNFLFFCADKNHNDLYSFNGQEVKNKCRLISNGKIICYDIPLNMLNNEGELPKEYINIREREYNKFKNKFSK